MTQIWRTLVAAAMVAGAVLFAPPGSAQDGDIIREIRVVGAQRVDEATVRSYLRARVGDPFGADLIDSSLKSLFETGYFTDVRVERSGESLVVTVVENPIINRIAFEGNRRIDDDVLESEIGLKPRQVYTRARAQADMARILELYRRSGRFSTVVEPRIIKLPQNRVDVAFEIDEGPQTRVRRIAFIGNARFGDGRLKEEITTKEAAWYRVLSDNDVYDPDRMAFDRERLNRFYLSEGYVDFRVASAVAELTRDRDGFLLTFTLEEGRRYRFGRIRLDNRLKDVPDDALTALMETETGEWYDSELVEKTVDAMSEEVGKAGFAFVDVRPETERNPDEGTVDVVFRVDTGPRVYVERIEIEGNVRTLDEVLRREFRLVEGDAFDLSKLRQTDRRLRNLGFFEKVEIGNQEGSRPDRTNVVVKVAERSTGELSFGAGYSTTNGPLFDVSLRERNLLGKGQDLRLGGQISAREQEIDLSFTEPYFTGRPVAAGFDIFRITRDNEEESSFDIESTGFALRAGYRLSEDWSQRWAYTLRGDSVDPGATASVFVLQERGDSLTSMLGHRIARDTRDNRFNPTEGHLLRLSTEIAGVGGPVRFVRGELTAAGYIPVFGAETAVLALSARGGVIAGLGQDVRLVNRFNLGGDRLRGFAVRGIGPRDLATGDSLGGNRYASATAELIFPLGLPDELGFKGRIFVEAGTLGGIDVSGPSLVDRASLRAAAGFGLSWTSPLGPLRLDFAWPLRKEDFDRTDNILFSIGTVF